jgi:hypothetical protein
VELPIPFSGPCCSPNSSISVSIVPRCNMRGMQGSCGGVRFL